MGVPDAVALRKNAGDPGLVLVRRLSNAEYNYTIRDLTGQRQDRPWSTLSQIDQIARKALA